VITRFGSTEFGDRRADARHGGFEVPALVDVVSIQELQIQYTARLSGLILWRRCYETGLGFSMDCVSAAVSTSALSGSRSAEAIRLSFDKSAFLPFSMSAISSTDSPQVRDSSSMLYPLVSRMALRALWSGAASVADSSEKASLVAIWGIWQLRGFKEFDQIKKLPETAQRMPSRW
jgi:hypothetical protein